MKNLEVFQGNLERAIQAQKQEIVREREARERSPQLFEAGLDTLDFARMLEDYVHGKQV